MIPHKVQIKNFLSYGAQLQTIDFGNYHLICLSGKNGHGKSALLDAMTWAVWGQARKTTASVKPDQGLLRLGQTQMMVIFDFEFNGNHYRIRREYIQTNAKSYAVLEFGIIDKKTNTLIPLTDKTIKTTQEKIEQTLHLDFESFVNSAFLRQGNANEFSKKSSKDRKDVLATILGLHHYEVIRKIALHKIKQAQIQEHTLAAFQEKAFLELKKIDQIRIELPLQLEQKAVLKKEYATLTREKDILIADNQTIAVAQQKLDMYTAQQSAIVQQEIEISTLLNNRRSQWRTTRAKSKHLPHISLLEKEKNRAVNATQLQQQKLQETLEIKAQLLQNKELLHTLEQEYNQKHAQESNKQIRIIERLKSDKNHIQHQLQTVQKESTSLEQEIQQLHTNQQELAKQISPIEVLEREITLQEKELEKRKETFQRLVAQGNLLKNQLRELNQKQHLTQEIDNPSCPLCEQNLSAARRKFLRQKFDNQERLLTHQIDRLTRILPVLKTSLINRHECLVKVKKEYDKSMLLIRTLEEQKKTIVKLSDRVAELHNASQELNSTDALLAQEIGKQETILNNQNNTASIATTNRAYQDLLQKHTALQTALNQCHYDAVLHQQIQLHLQTIEKQIQEHTDLLQELAQQNELVNIISELCHRLKEYKKQKNALFLEIEMQRSIVLQKEEVQNRFQHWEERFTIFEQTKEKVMHEITRLQTEEKKLKELEIESEELKQQSLQLAETISDYQTIAHATGKDGIQALLIEDAIPEIEGEANYLLSKLTNNQAQIFIESLRDLKSGGTKETLDIKISDAAGIRPYELFSGGEGFRIDFALRIAISKLLARRAGTALQTLIIDEGFGSQDEEGLAHIMDAIYKIQDDFSRIIIVSHLPALKDQFPVHFIVEKGPQGSRVKIMEHD